VAAFRPLALAFALSTAALPAFAEDLVFTLVNKSSSDLSEFYASPPGVDDWEEDILGVDVLESGRRVRITIADGRRRCRYDLRFVFDDGDEIDERKVDLCKLGTYTLSDR
jgi:hypothetical protein